MKHTTRTVEGKYMYVRPTPETMISGLRKMGRITPRARKLAKLLNASAARLTGLRPYAGNSVEDAITGANVPRPKNGRIERHVWNPSVARTYYFTFDYGLQPATQLSVVEQGGVSFAVMWFISGDSLTCKVWELRDVDDILDFTSGPPSLKYRGVEYQQCAHNTGAIVYVRMK